MKLSDLTLLGKVGRETKKQMNTNNLQTVENRNGVSTETRVYMGPESPLHNSRVISSKTTEISLRCVTDDEQKRILTKAKWMNFAIRDSATVN